jgi:hypothetical protein
MPTLMQPGSPGCYTGLDHVPHIQEHRESNISQYVHTPTYTCSQHFILQIYMLTFSNQTFSSRLCCSLSKNMVAASTIIPRLWPFTKHDSLSVGKQDPAIDNNYNQNYTNLGWQDTNEWKSMHCHYPFYATQPSSHAPRTPQGNQVTSSMTPAAGVQ